MAAKVKWTHNFGNVNGLVSAVRDRLPERVTKQWGTRWMGQIRKRFDRSSQGGGDWTPLAASTIARRRFSGGGTIGGARQRALERARKVRHGTVKVGAKDSANVRRLKAQLQELKRRGAVKKATALVTRLKKIAAAGQSVAILRNTGTLMRATNIGAPGNLFQPINKGIRAGFAGARVHKSGKATLAQIAAYHQRGGKNLPKREILVPPDVETSVAMKGDLQREIVAAMRANNMKPGPRRTGGRR